jgi:hypothetical protein
VPPTSEARPRQMAASARPIATNGAAIGDLRRRAAGRPGPLRVGGRVRVAVLTRQR